MKAHVRIVACMVSFTFLLAVPSALAQADKLVGVWKLIEVQYPEFPGAGPNPLSATKPQPSIAVFTKKHFSMTLITGKEPRLDTLKDPTKEQLVELFRTFSGTAGTYEVEGSTLTMHITVSWVPNYMNKPAPQEFRFEGDNLVLTTASKDPKTLPITMKFTRLE